MRWGCSLTTISESTTLATSGITFHFRLKVFVNWMWSSSHLTSEFLFLSFCISYRQQCTLLFGSWAHSNDSIKYSLYTPVLSTIDFYDNQEWELVLVIYYSFKKLWIKNESKVESNGFLYDYLDPPLFWEMIIINLVVERQSFYYGMFLFIKSNFDLYSVFNLVIPSTIITLVAVIGFHTPSTSGRVRWVPFLVKIKSWF